MLSPRHVSAAFSLSILMLVGAAAAGDKEEAKALFEQGLKQMESKSYDKACPAFERSQKLDPFPGTLFTLAECEALRGRAAAAYSRYGEYLQVYAALPREKQARQGTREKDARSKRADLARLVALVTLALPVGAPFGVEVTLDGAPLSPSALGTPLALDPGEHVATSKPPSGPLAEKRFTVEKGDTPTITLEAKVESAAKPLSTASATAIATAPPPSSARKTGAFIAGGVGLLGLVAGGITGGLMLSKLDVIKANCTDGAAGTKLCNARGAEAGNSAKLLGTIATAGFATAAVGLGLGIVLFATAPKAAAPGKTTAIEIRAVPWGPLGTGLDVRGSF